MSLQELLELLQALKRVIGEDALITTKTPQGKVLSLTRWEVSPDRVMLLP